MRKSGRNSGSNGNGKRVKAIISGGGANARGYPRPQLVREPWINLNGEWDFSIDADARETDPEQVKFDSTITVPFAPETPLSGVGNTGYFNAVWYRREFDAPDLGEDQRLILHFGAVDYVATVWVNGNVAAKHE